MWYIKCTPPTKKGDNGCWWYVHEFTSSVNNGEPVLAGIARKKLFKSKKWADKIAERIRSKHLVGWTVEVLG